MMRGIHIVMTRPYRDGVDAPLIPEGTRGIVPLPQARSPDWRWVDFKGWSGWVPTDRMKVVSPLILLAEIASEETPSEV